MRWPVRPVRLPPRRGAPPGAVVLEARLPTSLLFAPPPSGCPAARSLRAGPPDRAENSAIAQRMRAPRFRGALGPACLGSAAGQQLPVAKLHIVLRIDVKSLLNCDAPSTSTLGSV